jgi:hypothetical protein
MNTWRRFSRGGVSRSPVAIGVAHCLRTKLGRRWVSPT